MNLDNLLEFVEPYYKDKDIMHNMWHINLVKKSIDRILLLKNYEIDYNNLIYAMYFHGFIYSNEEEIRVYLKQQNISDENIEKIITISWESQRSEIPNSLEGKILHDAHILEGGKTYLVTKTLITGSLRGQTLKETIDYMKNNVLDKNICYLDETKPLCDEMNKYTNEYYESIIKNI